MDTAVIIEATQLVKHYRNAENPAVDGLSFNIRKGEIFGLLGPNGAGKTTTISMLCGLQQPDSGSITVMGKEFTRHFMELKTVLGVVPQDIALYPTLTGRENLEFYGAMYGVEKGVLKERIAEWLEKMDLTRSADRRVETYSGGMKRRVNLIAGILHQPAIVFLDEPTVGVDVQSRAAIVSQLRELNQQGMTIVYTSHHMEEAEKLCTEVAIMDQGRMIVHGRPEELIREHGCRDLEDLFLRLTHHTLRD